MPIHITQVPESTAIVIVSLFAALLLGFRKSEQTGLFTPNVTQELKGLAILSVVFSHMGKFLVDDHSFLFPLSIAAKVGVDLFLFMSGYGLTISLIKKPLSALEFYKRRLIKVFIPFWLVLVFQFLADGVILHTHYGLLYTVQSFLGWFPSAKAEADINAPFWYITWLLMFYVLLPLLFNPQKPWLTAIILAVVANGVAWLLPPANFEANWLHHIHSNGFPLGMVFAWLLLERKDGGNRLREELNKLRNVYQGWERYALIAALSAFAAYMAAQSDAQDSPNLASLLDSIGLTASYSIAQGSSLFCMMALILAFTLKQLDNKVLYFFGIYSYEIYLVHWPLMLRYDVFFHVLPAWLAVWAWIAVFIGIGWLLQKITSPLGAWLDSSW